MLSIRGVGLVYVVYVQRNVHGICLIYVVYIRCLSFSRAVLRLLCPFHTAVVCA